MSVVEVRAAITRAHHEEWARMVASLTRRFGDLDIAEANKPRATHRGTGGEVAAWWYQSCLAPGAAGCRRMGAMKGISGRSGWPHRAWPMWLPCVSAVVAGGLFVIIDLAGMVMGSWDTPVAGLGWLKAGASGQFGLAVVAAAVLIAGTANPSWRRGAATTGYAIIAVEIGWFLLTRLLVQDHP